MSSDRALLRAKHGHAHHRVSFEELFFDLVFVFAVTQLSHSLIEHLSLVGAVQTLLMMLAVWWVWMYTAWCTNWLDPEKDPVRTALLVLMLLGLVLSASIPAAFESRGLAFAGAYAMMQVGRTVFFLWAVRGHDQMVRNVQRILGWLTTSAVFWIAGAFAEGPARLALWGTALGLEYLAPAAGFWLPVLGQSTTADWDVEGGHMAERCGLFVIIALGESLLVSGATFSGMPWTAAAVGSFATSFIGSVAMWWLYFDTSAEVGSQTISRSSDPGRIARLAYTYIHLFMVAGIIVSAVGDELVLAHPAGHSDGAIALSVVGGVVLFLVGGVLFKWAILGQVHSAPLVGILVLVALLPVAGHLPPLALLCAATSVLVLIGVWEGVARARAQSPSSV